MKLNPGLGIICLVLASCGGSNKSAQLPATTSIATSNVSLSAEMTGADALDVTGPAFAKYDSGNKLLAVLLFDAATDPEPSCDLLDPSKAASLKKGTVVTFQIGNMSEAKAGDYPLGGVSYAKGDQAKGDMSMGGGSAPDGTKFKISQIDTSSMDAIVADPKTGKSFAEIHATVCQAGSLTPAGAQTASVGQGSTVDPMASSMSIAMNGKSQETSGQAMVKLDPKTKALSVYVWSDDFTPMPTCEKFGTASNDAQSGDFIAIGVGDLPKRTTGKFPVAGGAFVNIDTNTGKPIVGRGAFDATTIDIQQFDDGGFHAEITSAPTAKTKVSGKIFASVCDDGAITFGAGTDVDENAKPAKKKKKKKK